MLIGFDDFIDLLNEYFGPNKITFDDENPESTLLESIKKLVCHEKLGDAKHGKLPTTGSAIKSFVNFFDKRLDKVLKQRQDKKNIGFIIIVLVIGISLVAFAFINLIFF